MVNILQGDAAKGKIPVAYPCTAGETVSQVWDYSALATLIATDIIELAQIPPNAEPIDFILTCDDLDSDGTPTIVFDLGIMSGDWGNTDGARTCGAEILSGSTLAQAGGVERPTLKTAFRLAPSAEARSIGMKITTVAATPAAGSVNLTTVVKG